MQEQSCVDTQKFPVLTSSLVLGYLIDSSFANKLFLITKILRVQCYCKASKIMYRPIRRQLYKRFARVVKTLLSLLIGGNKSYKRLQ